VDAAAPLATESEAAIETYLDEVWLERGLADNTLAAYRRDLRQFARALEVPLLAVSPAELARCVADRYAAGYRTRSSARWLSCIKGFYRHQVRKGRLAVDPSADLESLGGARHLTTYFKALARKRFRGASDEAAADDAGSARLDGW